MNTPSLRDRLREIKGRYDLINLFQSNQNITPAEPVAACSRLAASSIRSLVYKGEEQ